MLGNKDRAREGIPEEVSLRTNGQGFVVSLSGQRVFPSEGERKWQLRLEGSNSCKKGSS